MQLFLSGKRIFHFTVFLLIKFKKFLEILMQGAGHKVSILDLLKFEKI
jgi:hypothetical protein